MNEPEDPARAGVSWRLRLAVAGTIAAATAIPLAAAGGFGYAAAGVRSAYHAVAGIGGSRQASALPPLASGPSSARGQYAPGSTSQQVFLDWQSEETTGRTTLVGRLGQPTCNASCGRFLAAEGAFIRARQAEQLAAFAAQPADVREDPAIHALDYRFALAVLALNNAHAAQLGACLAASSCSAAVLLRRQARESAKLARLQTGAWAAALAAVARAHGHGG